MKTVLITGAYRGLGLETARQLAARGFQVIITARDLEQAASAAAGLSNVKGLQLDLNDEASVDRAAQTTPLLDVLINNAAILETGDEDFLRIPLEIVERTLINNTVGALRMAQAFLPQLARSPAGRIVNVSSGGGQLGNGETSTWAPAYCISKTALNGVTCQLAAALTSQGIAVNSVCPGWCRTDMGGAGATRSVAEGAAGIAWLAADAPQDQTGLFWRDREIIPW